MVIKMPNKQKKISFNKFTVYKEKPHSNLWNLKNKDGKSLHLNINLTYKLQIPKSSKSLQSLFWEKMNKTSSSTEDWEK